MIGIRGSWRPCRKSRRALSRPIWIDKDTMEAIRLARPADRAAIEELVRAAYGPYVARLGREPEPMLDDYAALIESNYVNVLDRAGSIIGIAVLIPEERTMLLHNVAVSPSMQGKGRGRKLIAFAETIARAAGCEMICLYTNALMTENLAIYRRRGFTETRRGEEKGYQRVYMAKRLRPGQQHREVS
jgi:N-acetylglutamate synthase-like GNAT family acetyltransferase